MRIISILFIILFTGVLINKSDAQTFSFYKYSFDSSDYKSFTVFDTSVSNPWQVGHTLKSYLNPDSIPDKLLVTDTINNYPGNGNWSVILKIPTIQNVTDCYFQYPVWNLQPNDSVFFEATFDTGRTWVNLLTNSWGNPSTFPINVYSYYVDLADSTKSIYNPVALTGTERAKVLYIHFQYYIVVRTDGTNMPPDSISLRIRLQSLSSGTTSQGFALSGLLVYESSPSGIANVYSDALLKVYPNPASNYLQLTNLPFKQNLQYSIINTLGQVVGNSTLPANKTQAEVDVSGLPSGIYYILIKGKDGLVEGQKFIKE